MKLWNRGAVKSIRLTNLEILLIALSFILMVYLGSMLPYYIKQTKGLHEEREAYIKSIQTLDKYKLNEEEWKEWDKFLNLQLEGYKLDFPQGMDEYFFLGVVEGYLQDKAVRDLEVIFWEIEDTLPFKNYVYKVKYISSERVTKDIVHELPSLMEGITMKEIRIVTLSTGEYEAELLLGIGCQ